MDDTQTSLDNYSPVKSHPTTDHLVEDDEQDSDSDQGDYNIIYNPTTNGKPINNYIPDPSYKPDFTELNDSYTNNITKLLFIEPNQKSYMTTTLKIGVVEQVETIL